MTEVEQQQAPQNGIDLSAAEDDDNSKSRPADIEQDMREMERRKRVEAIMSSKLFREELERIVDSAREGGTSGILQQLSDIVGVPASRVGSLFKTSNCMVPINDIRGVESMGYAKGEKILRCKLAATFRLLDLYGWTQGLGALISARLKVDQEYFLVNPYGLMFHEITASSLNKVDMQGNIVEQGTTNFGVNKGHFILHSVVHAARPDIRCAIYIGCSPVVAVSSLKTGLLPITKDACVLGEITTYAYTGSLDNDERDKLVRNLGPISKVMLLSNHGALCCGETIEEAFFAACHIVQACETQLKLLPVGLDNLVLIPEESRKHLYEQSRRPPEDLEKKFAAALNNVNAASQQQTQQHDGEQTTDENAAPTKTATNTTPKWRVGGAEFEALMRMLDNAGYRTGYIYRHPLIKSDPPKPKNDVELPPAVSSLGYLLEEEELFKQGIWKKGDIRKGGDRSRWLNSPNVYQKVEVLETGTPDPKKITKWVAEGSPTHSTPVRIEDPLQFVPANTNPKEFKRLQQQIKDNRRADKISAGPQSHILEGVTWDEANRIKDATVSQTGDHVVLMGAASKGIIQRGFQHNATVYKAPYAKNPFDNVTDDELNEYKRTVERKKKSIHGEYTDTDFSESEALSSQPTSGAQQTKQTTTSTTAAAVSQSEPEDISEHQVMRIETQQAPVPSQPEVVLSDAFHNQIHLTTKIENLRQHHQDSYLNLNENLLELKRQIISRKLKNILLARKYKFLYEQPSLDFQYKSNFIIQTIHKIEVFPNHTYPTMNNSTNNSNEHQSNPPNNNSFFITKNLNTSESLAQGSSKTKETKATPSAAISALQPYRTVSHYGFNYPLTYMPTISLHPTNMLSSVEEQRQKVIAYIRKTAMSYAQRQYSPEMVKKYTEKLLKKEKQDEKPSGNDSFVSFKEIQLTPKSEKLKKKGSIKEEKNNSKENPSNSEKKLSSPFQTSESEHDIDVLCEKFSSLLLHKKGAVKEQLDRSKENSPSSDKKLSLSQTSEMEHDIDFSSEQFSSLLSISGIYPNATIATPPPSQTQSCDHEQHDYDSGDNYSSLTAPPRMSAPASVNLYRSYFLRNFLPLRNHSMNLNSPECQQNDDEHHGEHIHNNPDDEEISQYEKPEAEQNIHSNDFHTTGDSAIEIDHYPLNDKQKHFKLTLNTKRNRNPSARRRIRVSSSSHDEAPSCSSSITNASNTSSSVKTLEIHVNITIKNSDCAKTLHAHEQEFKTKLENVIDNEIQLIADQLAFSQYIEQKQQKSSIQLNQNQGKIFERRSSAPEMDLNNNNDTLLKCNKTSSQNNSSNLSLKDHKKSLRKCTDTTPHNYHDALYLLEQELETLLNNIIRSNELHNRAIMCSCKTKISQITENIKNSLNNCFQ